MYDSSQQYLTEDRSKKNMSAKAIAYMRNTCIEKQAEKYNSHDAIKDKEYQHFQDAE